MIQKIKQVDDTSIGNNLRELRQKSGMTQEQVVAQLHLRNLEIGIKKIIAAI